MSHTIPRSRPGRIPCLRNSGCTCTRPRRTCSSGGSNPLDSIRRYRRTRCSRSPDHRSSWRHTHCHCTSARNRTCNRTGTSRSSRRSRTPRFRMWPGPGRLQTCTHSPPGRSRNCHRSHRSRRPCQSNSKSSTIHRSTWRHRPQFVRARRRNRTCRPTCRSTRCDVLTGTYTRRHCSTGPASMNRTTHRSHRGRTPGPRSPAGTQGKRRWRIPRGSPRPWRPAPRIRQTSTRPCRSTLCGRSAYRRTAQTFTPCLCRIPSRPSLDSKPRGHSKPRIPGMHPRPSPAHPRNMSR